MTEALDDLKALYQETILEHSKRPRNFGKLAGATVKARGYNPLCGDQVTLYLALDERRHIQAAGFEGKGCALCLASASLLTEARAAYPSSGEINFRVTDAAAVVARVEQAFAAETISTDRLDGLSLSFADWRLNLRSSNTEPLLRLNVETRGDMAGLAAHITKVSNLITS